MQCGHDLVSPDVHNPQDTPMFESNRDHSFPVAAMKGEKPTVEGQRKTPSVVPQEGGHIQWLGIFPKVDMDMIMPRSVIDQRSQKSTPVGYEQYHLAQENAQGYEQCNGYDHYPNEGIIQAYTQVFVCLAENVGSNQLHRFQTLEKFEATFSYSLEQSLTMVELAKEQEKINGPIRLEEPPLLYNLWCQEQPNQMRFEKSNRQFKNMGTVKGEDIYNSDKLWRRLIRSVLEQDLVTLRSSQVLILL